MPIKAVILDVSGTLVQRSGDMVEDGPRLIIRLRDLGLAVFLASNNPVPDATLALLGVPRDGLLTRATVGGAKGSRRFVETVCSRLGIQSNELLYLGDEDNDMREAVNSNIAFFLATWANPDYPYGFPVSSPRKFYYIVRDCFLKHALWYYRVDDADSAGRPIHVRALLSPDETKSTGIEGLLKRKVGGDAPVGEFTLSEYLSLHLLASLYLEGLHLPHANQRPIWCLYPGHAGEQTGVLDDLATFGARLFREPYADSLIYRHQRAIKSAYARTRGEQPTLANQIGTIHLRRPPEVAGRRVLVFDDFTTEGYGYETARNLLLHAGATDIYGIAVGKYRRPYIAHVPRSGIVWDSYQPVPLDDTAFTHEAVREHYDVAALNDFLDVF